MQTLFLIASHANGDHHHWWFPIFPLLWTALIIGAIYLFTRGRRRGGSNRAKEILAERYASGELTIDEYRERLAHLG